MSNTVPVSVVVTVVIPSYNCAQWLKRAVASAFALSQVPVEVIIVDDGSTDETPAICEALKKQYPGLRIIRQPNGGLSSARNTGVDAAFGDFIIFLDADDELMPFDLKIIESFDGEVLRIGVEEVLVDETVRYWREVNSRESGLAYLKCHLESGNLYAPSWAYVCRRSFLNEHELRFIPGLIHEDMIFTIEVLLKAPIVGVIDTLLYRYFRRIGSITLEQSVVSKKRRILSLGKICNRTLILGNKHPEVDLWRWAEHVTDYAWSLAVPVNSRCLLWHVMRMELALFFGYRIWGEYRNKRDARWRLRVGLKKMFFS